MKIRLFQIQMLLNSKTHVEEDQIKLSQDCKYNKKCCKTEMVRLVHPIPEDL